MSVYMRLYINRAREYIYITSSTNSFTAIFTTSFTTSFTTTSFTTSFTTPEGEQFVECIYHLAVSPLLQTYVQTAPPQV